MIYILGDCYSRSFKYLPDSWIQMMSKDLNQKIISYAKVLTTQAYCFTKFNQLRNNFKENDILILSLTAFHVPGIHAAGENVNTFAFNPNSDEAKTLFLCQEQLNFFNELYADYLNNFLHNVDYLTKKLNLHTIVLANYQDVYLHVDKIRNNYNNLHFTDGYLNNVTMLEWEEEILRTKEYLWMLQNDIRVNHIVKSNHGILADKILNNIRYKQKIDLNSGFRKHIMNDKLIKDPKFIEEELFSGFVGVL